MIIHKSSYKYLLPISYWDPIYPCTECRINSFKMQQNPATCQMINTSYKFCPQKEWSTELRDVMEMSFLCVCVCDCNIGACMHSYVHTAENPICEAILLLVTFQIINTNSGHIALYITFQNGYITKWKIKLTLMHTRYK